MDHAPTLDLSKPIAGYFAAEAFPGSTNGSGWFAPGAEVHDEGRTHKGVDAIRTWQAEAKAKTAYVVEPLTVTQVGARTLVSARVTGSFPGSPVILDYAFTLANDRIVDLDIRP
ncbi:MAG: nuclear transport factor 2 family protein [Sphingomicrobium sp.]